jgi:phage terminase large subunit-like protein
VRRACERHLRDLKAGRFAWNPIQRRRSGRADTPVERVCRFVESLRHVKGPLAGQCIRLEDWQVFVIGSAFGWIGADGARRFRRVYVEVPRGNAKSTLSAALALYCLCADDELGAEVYSVATAREQARIVFDAGAAMVRMDATMRDAFGIEQTRGALYIERTHSKFSPLASDKDTLEGLNVHFGCIDELHAHKTRAVYDVMETATGKRHQSLLWSITTAGFDRSRVCYEVRGFVLKVLDGVVQDEQTFGIIYTIDDEDDWTTEAALQKANPNWGVSVMPDVIRGLQAKAMASPAALNNFLTKHLNKWVSTHTAWIDMRAWQACADSSLRVEQFAGEPCYVGLDLASKIDIAASVLLFVRDGEYYAFARYWLPEEQIDNAQNSQYAGWAHSGAVTRTPGNVIDFDLIEDAVAEQAAQFGARAVAFDPWQATQLATHLLARGAPMVECPMTVKNLSEPMKALQAAIVSGRFHHNGDPVLEWMASNVVAYVDAKENMYPRKERPENKIDGIVALIMAMNRAVVEQQSGPSVYETRGLLSLGA